jgi:hypothetical protein
VSNPYIRAARLAVLAAVTRHANNALVEATGPAFQAVDAHTPGLDSMRDKALAASSILLDISSWADREATFAVHLVAGALKKRTR